MTAQDAIANLKQEWAGICRAMNNGTWQKTEQAAVERMEEIRAMLSWFGDSRAE